MSDCIFAMKTQTEAEKARRAALHERITAEIVYIDPSLTKRGCSVGIRFPCEKTEIFRNILDQHRISYGDLIGGSRRVW